MRVLKIIMFIMIGLVVAALGVVGYFYSTARVSIAAYGVNGMEADREPALFSQVKEQVEEGSFQGTLFSTSPLGSPEDYAFITFTIRVSNQCLVPIDMVEVQVVPEPADILQIGDTQVRSLEAKSLGDISATILTAKDSHSVREVIVSYYVWGVSFSLRQTCGG